MSTLGDKLRCPHCLEEIDHLENPKQLPCNHIYCSPCLETLTETVQTGVIITCSICSGSHHAINLGVLADINPPQSDKQMNDKPSQEDTCLVLCDKCVGGTTPAVCYCTECDRKLCRKHEEIHQQYFCEKMAFPHKLISIETYNLRPNFYTKPACKLHGHEYTFCCRHCLCPKCKSCTVADDCKVSVETKHFYQTMEDTTQQLKDEFYALSKECSDCITNMCRQEKETWLKLDEIEEECENLRNQVRKKTEHLVSELWKEHNRLKESIQSYESEAKDMVETYLGKLRAQREQLGETREECSRFVRDSHVSQIIAEREKRVGLLQETKYTQLEDIPDMLLLRGSLQGFLDLPSPSKNINYLYQRETKNLCFSASFDAAGSLYICSAGGLDIYRQYEGTGSRKKIDTGGIITSVGFEPGSPNVYYIRSPHDKQLVYKYTSSSAEPIELFTYEYPGNFAPFLTVSDTYIAATANRSLTLYNIRKGKQVFRELEFQPAKVCFLSTSYLLTTSTPENRLYMFKIRDTEDMELTTVWICNDLKGADGLCVTKDNVIVVKAEKGGALYLVSTQGLPIVHNKLQMNQVYI